MDDAGGVRVRDRSGHERAEIRNSTERHGTLTREDLAEVVSVYVLHGQVERAGARAAKIKNVNGVWMVETRCGLCFAVKAGDVLLVVFEVAMEELDRHRLSELNVLGPIHGPHGAFADALDDTVALGDDVAGVESRLA